MIVGKLVERAAEQIRDRLLDQGYVLKGYSAADFCHGARRYLEENNELKAPRRARVPR